MELKYLYMNLLILIYLVSIFSSCTKERVQDTNEFSNLDSVYVQVLGIAQDAGFPQANCEKSCCRESWSNPQLRQKVACLAICEKGSKRAWMLDATPDFRDQLHFLKKQELNLAGIFISHAHIGHYTGLIHLGREVIGAKEVPVYGMPRMLSFLSANGPWSQLVELNNISLRGLEDNVSVRLSDNIQVTPILVPHRDEFSETVGFLLQGPQKKLLYIPDIDKWQLWSRDIRSMVQDLDYLFIDGSFYAEGEIPGRNMDEIPHPFIQESMDLFQTLDKEDKSKIYFIHLNHTNPILDKSSIAYRKVLDAGFKIASESMQIAL